MGRDYAAGPISMTEDSGERLFSPLRSHPKHLTLLKIDAVRRSCRDPFRIGSINLESKFFRHITTLLPAVPYASAHWTCSSRVTNQRPTTSLPLPPDMTFSL